MSEAAPRGAVFVRFGAEWQAVTGFFDGAEFGVVFFIAEWYTNAWGAERPQNRKDGETNMKKILLLATGGTIASKNLGEGLTPALTAEDLLTQAPEISHLCRVDAEQFCNQDSTNMRPENWVALARRVREAYADYDGFVITHGTDTMAYAAACLYYLLQNIGKPVVLTGSQVSIFERNSDARDNLTGAFRYACDKDASGVRVFFDRKVICGARARKTRTRSFNAFSSVDYPEVAVVRDGRVQTYIRDEVRGEPVFYDRLDPAVLLVKLTPGIDAGILDYAAAHMHAVVIESFGVGGIPHYEDSAFERGIEHLLEQNVRVVIATQVAHEGSAMETYRVGYRIKERYHLPEAYEMTTEAVIAKTMWALTVTDTKEEFKRVFETPVGPDLL